METKGNLNSELKILWLAFSTIYNAELYSIFQNFPKRGQAREADIPKLSEISFQEFPLNLNFFSEVPVSKFACGPNCDDQLCLHMMSLRME